MHVRGVVLPSLLAAAVVLLSSGANALTLSGNYVWRLSKICQNQLGVEWENNAHVVDVFALTGPSSQTGTELGIASFPDAKHVTIKGYSVLGPAVAVNPNPNQMPELAISRARKYRTTSNTLLLTDPVSLLTDEYRAVFNRVINNVAHEVYFQRKTGPCAITGSLIKQE